MIPRTFPSVFGTAGETKMVVYVLPSITGLQAWKDYIPVKGVTSESNVLQNTYNNGGYQVMNALDSITGKQAWKDYIPVYEDAAYNKPWSTDAGGYIPGAGLFSVLGSLFANNEQGAWYDPSDIDLTWRRNLLKNTNDASYWGNEVSNASIAVNAAAAPDGGMTADVVSFTSPGGFFGKYSGSDLWTTLTPGLTYTFSLFIKPTANDITNFGVQWLAYSGGGTTSFNLTGNGSVATLGANHTATIVKDAVSGYYRISVSCLCTSNLGGYRLFNNSNTTSIAVAWVQAEIGNTASAYQHITDGVQDYFVADPQPVLFQDSAGTTPVTAVEQPVGLVLDKRKGLVLGSELVTNGDFSQGTTGWTAGSGITLTAEAGRLKVTTDGTLSTGAQQTISGLVSGKTYLLTWEFTQGNRATNNAYIQAFAGMPGYGGFTAGGTYRYVFTANATSGLFIVRNAGSTQQAGDYWYVDNISVRELPGNHAYQSTSASRPVLSARVNLLTKTEQFDDAAWTKTAATVVSNATTAPDGTLTADKLVASTDATNHYIYQNGFSANQSYSVYVKAGGYNYVGIGDGSNIFGAFFNLDSVTASVVKGLGTAEIVSVGNGWFRLFGTVSSSPQAQFRIFVVNTASNNAYSSWAGDGTSGIYIWGADLRVANTGVNLPAYQRVNTATDYATEGFPKYLKFDGVDDFLVTNSIDFSATAQMTVVAGVRNLSDAIDFAVLAELSSTWSGNNGTFVLCPKGGGGAAAPSYYMGSRGTLSSNVGPATSPAPTTGVLAVSANIAGDSLVLRVNGTQAASSTADQGTGNFGNYPLYIGRRGGTSLPFNGHLYGLIVRGAASSAFQISGSEKYMNGVTKAY